jgi:hypothetical protein
LRGGNLLPSYIISFLAIVLHHLVDIYNNACEGRINGIACVHEGNGLRIGACHAENAIGVNLGVVVDNPSADFGVSRGDGLCGSRTVNENAVKRKCNSKVACRLAATNENCGDVVNALGVESYAVSGNAESGSAATISLAELAVGRSDVDNAVRKNGLRANVFSSNQ